MFGDQFGRRYVQQRAFIDYAKRLGVPAPFLDDVVEFAERFAILRPAARVRYPDPIVRRWSRERYPDEKHIEPIEPDGERLQAANALRNALERDLMQHTELPGGHPFDSVAPEFRQFVSTEFSRSTFAPWSTFRTEIYMRGKTSIGGQDGVQTYYHAWQVFQLAAFVRSRLAVLYDVTTDHAWDSLMDLRGRDDVRVSANLDAYAELKTLEENAGLFDAVATFDDLRHRSFQVHARGFDRRTGRLSPAASRAYYDREAEIAGQVVAKAKLSAKRLIEFIRLLCEQWDRADERYPAAIKDAYKRTIASTIELLRLTNRRYTGKKVVARVGAVGGWHRPTLEVIFPNWVDEQRAMVEASLAQWIVPRAPQMPAEFAFATSDVAPFCDWIERKGFLQFYWHFRRLTDIGRFDDNVARTATASEIVGIASLIEHLATQALADRKPPVLHKGTLFPKLRDLLRVAHPALEAELVKNSDLVGTKQRTLRQQLDRIRRRPLAGPNAPVLRVLLRLVLIRNAASHGGLPGFERDQMQRLIESLLISALVVWKAR
jgi:hypothetical protein